MFRMSGIGRYLQTLLPGVIAHLAAPRIRVFCDPQDVAGQPWLRDPRVEVHALRTPIFTLAEQVNGAKRLWTAPVLWVPQYNIPLLYRGKLIVTIHDLCQLAYPESLSNSLQRGYARYLLNTVARRAAAILCVSEFTRSEIQRFMDADPSRIVTIHPGSGLTIDPREPESGRDGRPCILAVGNIKKHKNLGRLIQGFAKISDRAPHDLLIVGKQEGMLNADPDLAQASSLLAGRVRFTGHVSDDQLRALYRSAAALVFPSLYEGFGFPILEAMALGCPVACSHASSLPEVAGDAALFFDPLSPDAIAEAILTILTDMDVRERLIQSGFTRVRMFDAGVAGRRTADVINSVLVGEAPRQD